MTCVQNNYERLLAALKDKLRLCVSNMMWILCNRYPNGNNFMYTKVEIPPRNFEKRRIYKILHRIIPFMIFKTIFVLLHINICKFIETSPEEYTTNCSHQSPPGRQMKYWRGDGAGCMKNKTSMLYLRYFCF